MSIKRLYAVPYAGFFRNFSEPFPFLHAYYLTNIYDMETLQSDLHYKIAETKKELQSCYRLRFQVYCENKRWLSPSDFPNGMEMDEYDGKAIHVLAFDEDFKIVGMMRILRDKDYQKLPFVDHPGMSTKNFTAPNLAELSRFVVTAKKNRTLVTRGLLRAVYQTSRTIGIENWVFVLEPSLVRLLGRFKFYLDPIGIPAMYFGGYTLAAVCNIRRTEKMWKLKDKETLRFNQSNSVLFKSEKAVA